MRPVSKIQHIRNEFERIGCPSPADVFAYRLQVLWNFNGICVWGEKVETFDFDILSEILRSIPNNAGEDFFWQKVASTDMNKMAAMLDEKNMAQFLKENLQAKKKKSRTKKVLKKKTRKKNSP